MKLRIQLLSAILLSVFGLTGLQAQKTITLSFNSSSTIDSIKIENLNNKTSRIIKSAGITLQLDALNGFDEVGLIGNPLAYPNPFNRQVNIDLPALCQSRISVIVTDLSGKVVAQLNKNMEPGSHRFTFKPGKSGVYLIKVSDKSSVYNAKLICTEASSGYPVIEYDGELPMQLSKQNKVKTTNTSADLKVNTGDQLQFTGYSNSRKKTITDFAYSNKDYTYSFIDNLWEYLAKDQRLDSIRTYLYSFDKIVFDETKSTPVDVNELGQTVYKDSVFYNANKIWTRLGALNNEDSSYIAILPTNNGWINSYNTIKNYFRYYSTPANQYSVDTLQRNSATRALVQDLVFRNKNQSFSNDSLVSTTNNVFYNPTNLIAGATKQDASNGTIYVTDELKYNHWEAWNKKIVVEAENAAGRTDFLSTLSDRTYSGADFAVSGNRYIEVEPISVSLSPTVTFEIPNTLSGKTNADSTTLSGTSYNIYCVFMPSTVRSTVAKPVKVSFQLSYLSEAGKVVTTTYDNGKKYFVTNKDQMTKILVASKVAFPYCESGLKQFNVKLKVINNVLTKETVDYNRDLLIDCIVLEPVH